MEDMHSDAHYVAWTWQVQNQQHEHQNVRSAVCCLTWHPYGWSKGNSFCVYFEPSVLLEKLTPLPIQHFSQPSIWHVMINKQCFNFCKQAISPKLGWVRPFIFTSTTVVLATILQTLSMFLIFLTLLLTLYTNLDATWIYLNMGIF